ncbi:MAG: 3-methyl-2-oxobutanoate hydroxymethyltransferase [Actinomycetota bacterium]
MPRILDYTGQDAERTVTVADVAAAGDRDQPLVQVTAGTADEAAAAEEAGIEMVVCLGDAVPAVRLGSSKVFVTAAIDFGGAITEDDILAAAFDALVAGADAVITARGLSSVERLTHEDIPTMGHLGFVPKKSNLLGGVRAVGKTADEAVRLLDDFRRLEEAGAFAVECELIPARVMSIIRQRTGMTTISLGSGGDADVIFLFMNDLCGESPRKPRHARAYADLSPLHEQVRRERVRALEAFRADATSGAFPSTAEEAGISDDELAALVARLED